MILSFTKLIILCQSIVLIKGEKILFPISDKIIWHEAVAESIQCNTDLNAPPIEGGIEIPGFSPILADEYKIDGYYCTRVSMITECEKGFWGGESITQKTIKTLPSQEECIIQFKNHQSGEEKIKTYPAPDCTWMDITTRHNTYIQIIESQTHYDPYTNEILSPSFINYRCKDQSCPTTSGHTLWIHNQDDPPKCKSQHLDRVLMIAKHKGNEMFDFWSPDINLVIGEQMCMMDYCGISGILFHHNLWIGLDKASIPKKDRNLGEFLYKLIECNKTEKLLFADDNYSVHSEAVSEIDHFLRMECEKTKGKLIENISVTRTELQALSPRSPGMHPVYRINNNTLEVGLSDYKFVNIELDKTGSDIIFNGINGKTVRWKYWTRFNTYLDGPNGIFIKNNKIHYFLSDLTRYKNALKLGFKSKMSVNRPVDMKSIKIDFLSEESWDSAKTGGKNIGDILSNGWTKFKQWVIGIIVFLIVSLILLYVTCFIIKKRNNSTQLKRAPKMTYYMP
jgi:hypothetical protein